MRPRKAEISSTSDTSPLESGSQVDERQFVTALARGLHVLQSFKSGEEQLGNQELALRCALPKSTISRLTYTLTQLGFLVHDSESARYRLGMATIKLGGTTLSRLEAVEVSRPLMQELADKTGTMIALGIRDGMSMLYIETCRSDSMVTIRLNIGSRIPIATTSMGRAYIAAIKPGARKTIEDRLKALDPQSWPAQEASVRRSVQEYEEYGCCSSFQDWRDEVNSIAAPVRLGHGLPLMILSSAAAAQVISPEIYLNDIRNSLLSTVKKIEKKFAE
jgi:DNA-binding IclR family transcriptional regulator